MDEVGKAVIPAAGLGTRFLPATKSIPKEMLPVVDRPAIEYVVREAAGAGLDDVLLITGRGKQAIEDHFDHSGELEQVLRAKGDARSLAIVEEATRIARIHCVRQPEPLGLGHAVGLADKHVGGEPFAVLLGDDLIHPGDSVLEQLIAVRRRFGGSVLCLMEVPPEEISRYGAAAVRATADNDRVEVTDLVEKPRADQAPSNLALVGRYVLDPAVFDVLNDTAPGRGGEIQLTDALRTLIDVPRSSGGGVHGVVFRGRRHDTGDKQGYLRALVTLALEDPHLGADFGSWLSSLMIDRGLAAGD
jgi:UTP--glucose-1-phosphate uridylyltransferase